MLHVNAPACEKSNGYMKTSTSHCIQVYPVRHDLAPKSLCDMIKGEMKRAAR